MKEFEELQQLKEVMMEEREKANKERAEKEENTERKDDYLSQLISIATKVEHNIGVYLPAAYIDTGNIMDYKLCDIYRGYINTISNFLRLFEQIEGDQREAAVKEAIIKLRFVFLEITNNLIKPILTRAEESGEYPKQNIDTFKEKWDNSIAMFKEIADKLYAKLDTKSLSI